MTHTCEYNYSRSLLIAGSTGLEVGRYGHNAAVPREPWINHLDSLELKMSSKNYQFSKEATDRVISSSIRCPQVCFYDTHIYAYRQSQTQNPSTYCAHAGNNHCTNQDLSAFELVPSSALDKDAAIELAIGWVGGLGTAGPLLSVDIHFHMSW